MPPFMYEILGFTMSEEERARVKLWRLSASNLEVKQVNLAPISLARMTHVIMLKLKVTRKYNPLYIHKQKEN